LQAGGHRFDPGQLHQIATEFGSKTGKKQGHCPMLGVKPTPSLFNLRSTRNVVLAPIIGQVRRATIIQRHLKLNKELQGESRKPQISP
jgi:hypothetical protein